MLEILCKIAEAIINTMMKTAVKFHYILHGFCANQGTGMAIMELNTAHDKDKINHDPLLLVFLELRNSYETIYHGHLIHTL